MVDKDLVCVCIVLIADFIRILLYYCEWMCIDCVLWTFIIYLLCIIMITILWMNLYYLSRPDCILKTSSRMTRITINLYCIVNLTMGKKSISERFRSSLYQLEAIIFIRNTSDTTSVIRTYIVTKTIAFFCGVLNPIFDKKFHVRWYNVNVETISQFMNL